MIDRMSGANHFMRILICAAAIAFCVVPALATGELLNPYAFPQSDSAPDEMIALIEIPEGSINKYEIDSATGLRLLSRVISMPVAYPMNYGAFPRTSAGDGDPLDALVLAREPIDSGTLVRVRPIGVLRMLDGGKPDQKVVCVPVSEVDPTYDTIQTIEDLPQIQRDRIEAFFRVYKDLPDGRKAVELDGFGSAEEAKKLISEALNLRE